MTIRQIPSARRPREVILPGLTGELAAKFWERDAGIPAVALHGWLDNANSFDRLLECLPSLSALALDFPGHGLSAHRPPGCAYYFADYATDVLAAADAAGFQRFVLIGHSMGAGVASLLAGMFPERVIAAVLIEGLGPVSGDAVSTPARLRRAALQMLSRQERSPPMYPTREAAVLMRQQAGDGLSRDAADRLCDRALVSAGDGVTWRTDPALRFHSPLRFTEDQVLACLARITSPACCVRARQGLKLPEAYEARFDAVANLQVEELDGHHHLHMEDTVVAVAEVIQAFLLRETTAESGANSQRDGV